MDDWKEELPEALRDAPFIGKAENMEDAVGKLAHAATLVGTSLRIPGEDASDEDRDAFFAKLTEVDGVARLPLSDDEEGLNALLTKMGKPEDHTGYKLPNDIEGFEWDETMGEALRQYAANAGLTTKQFDALSRQIAEQEQTAGREGNQALEDLRKELRLDWGDTLEDREAMIRGWLEKSDAPEDFKELFEERNLPLATMNWLHRTAKEFKGDVAPISKGQEGVPSMTPEEARHRRGQIINDMVGMPQTDPRYRDLQKELVAVGKLAHGKSAA
jgi:hypothetical protein